MSTKKTILTPSILVDLSRRYREAVIPGDVASLAMKLGVSVDSLRRIGIGWDGAAFAFPMFSGDGTIIGIHRRLPERKICLARSKLGIFVPCGLVADPLLIVEGCSDTAAALTAGFDAIGLPSAGNGFDHAAEFLRRNHRRQVVIVADLDDAKRTAAGDVRWPGIESAIRLAEVLMPAIPHLHFLLPPDGTKDIRQWLRASGADSIRAAVASAPPVTPAWINQAWRSVEQNRQRLLQPDWARQVSAMLAEIDDPDVRADLRFQFEERVAIAEIDGGLPVDEAERIAFEQVRHEAERIMGRAEQ